MKTFKINIQTSWEELAILFRRAKNPKTSKKHNYEVINELYQDISGYVKSGYWDKDISEKFRENFLGELVGLIQQTKSKLK